MSEDTVLTYMGRPLAELSREELIGIVEQLADVAEEATELLVENIKNDPRLNR